MLFSVWDPDTERYYYYSGKESFWIRFPSDYSTANFIPFQAIEFALPNDAAPNDQSGPEAKGVIVSPQQLHRPQCSYEVDLFLLALGALAKWALPKMWGWMVK